MLLSARDAAKLLRTSERQIYRWVDAEEMPFQRIRDQVRFNRSELLEWATTRRLPVSLEAFDIDADAEDRAPSLAAALRRGGVHHDVPAEGRDEAIAAVVTRTPLPAHLDRELVTEMHIVREATSSTAIGEGIAIPHVRHPVIAAGAPATVSLSYLRTPLPFGAPDGRSVFAIFMIVSPTVRGHLQLLARLGRALHDPAFKAAVERRASLDELVDEMLRLEAEPLPEVGPDEEVA
jgi:PTS system nitrogen regulatory IIA component